MVKWQFQYKKGALSLSLSLSLFISLSKRSFWLKRSLFNLKVEGRGGMAEPDTGAGVGGDWAPSVGARVRLHSLLRTPEHSGAEGEVVEAQP